MKAIQISGLRQMQIVSVPEQELHADEVLLRLEYGKNPMVKMPVIPGHEIGAVIEKVGTDVPEGLKPGMTVTCNPYTNCGKCASCRNSRVNACQHNETLGVQRNGAMREYIVLPWEKVNPAGLLTPRTCALIEPMSVGFHAVSRAQVTDIDVVLVIGCGMVGMGAVVRSAQRGATMGAVVRSAQRGATVVAADIDDEKLELAKQMGASYIINTKTEDVHARLLEMTSGFGPDVVIEAVGSTQTYQMAVDEVAFTGRVICIGYAKTEVSFQTKFFVQKELDIRGSRNAQPSDFRAVIHYLERGTCPVDRLISKEVSPEEAPEAIQQWADNPGKTFRILVRFQ